VSASVNLPLHHKVQKFSSGTGAPGWSRKKGRKTVVVWCGGGGMLKWVSPFRLCSNNKWQWQIWTHAQDGWLGLRTGHLTFILHSSNKPGELLQWTTLQTLSQQLYKHFIRHADNTHTCSSQCCLKTSLFLPRFPLSCLQNNSGLSRTSQIFSGLFHSPSVFKYPDKQQFLLTLYIQRNSNIQRKTFIKDTVWLIT